MPSVMKRVRQYIEANKPNVTLAELREGLAPTPINDISTALCYLQRRRYLSRELIPNPNPKGRKQVYLYTYHPERLPKEPLPYPTGAILREPPQIENT